MQYSNILVKVWLKFVIEQLSLRLFVDLKMFLQHFIVLTLVTFASVRANVETRFLTQRLDHFNPQNRQTWNMVSV
jgi:hypothetical protein